MVANHPKQVTPKGTQFPGIKSAARSFGVHRVTLYRILKGQYPDKRKLRSRYEKWLAKYLPEVSAARGRAANVLPVSPTRESGNA